MATMAGEAAEFVRFNAETKKFEVDQAAVRTLQRLKGPVAVVVVCGRARQGKSFLLNQLISRLKGVSAAQAPKAGGFAVAATYRPCTKGLWLWSQPVQRKMADGTPYHLVLVDAEGIDAFDQTLDYSTQIFSLGVLLSSLLVFNQMGSIDESSVDKLSNVCEFAKLIKGKAGGSRDLQELSPAFLWLLRDFQFDLTERDGRKLTMRDYMEETLQDMPGSTDGVRNRNQMRSSIKALFPERDCFALVRPMSDEQQLAKMDTLPYSALRPEFKKGLEGLVDLLVGRAQPKQFHGSYMTGAALAAFAQAYVEVINKGGVPAISSTWQSVVAGECARALEAALDVYRREYSSEVEPEEAQLDAEHRRALGVAVAQFAQQALGAPAERAEFEARLRARANDSFQESRTARLAQASGRLSQLLGEASGRFAEVYHRSPLDVQSSEVELEAFMKNFDAQVRGPSKYYKMAEFLYNTCVRGLGRVVTAGQQDAAAQRTRADAATAQLATAKQRGDELALKLAASQAAEGASRQQLVREQQQHTATTADLAERRRGLQASEAARDTQHRELLEAKSRAEVVAHKLAASETAEAAGRQQLAAAQQQLSRLNTDLGERAQQLTQALARAQESAQKLAVAEATLTGGRQQLAALQQQLAAAQQQASRQTTDLGDRAEQLTQARARADKLAQSLAAAEAAGQQGVSASQQQATRAAAELAAAQQEVARLRSDDRDKAQQLAQVRERAEQSAQRLSSLETTVAAERQQLANAQQQAARSATDLRVATEQLAQVRRELGESRTAEASAHRESSNRVQQTSGDLERLRMEVQTTTQRATAAEAAAQELQEQVRVKEEALAAVRREQTQNEGIFGRDRVEMAQLRQQVAERERQMGDREETVRNLTQRNQFLENENDRLQRRVSMGSPLAAAHAPAAATAPPAARAGPSSLRRGRDAADPVDDVEMADTDAPPASTGPRKRARREAAQPAPATAPPAPRAAEAPAAAFRFSGDTGAGSSGAAGPAPTAPPAAAAGPSGFGAAFTPVPTAAAAQGDNDQPGASPFSQEREIRGRPSGAGAHTPGNARGTPLAATPTTAGAAAAAAPRPALTLPANADTMTLGAIKVALTEAHFEEDVFALSQKRPAAKKADWLKLLREKCGL